MSTTKTATAPPVGGVQCPFPIPSSPCRCSNATVRRRGGGGGGTQPPLPHRFGGPYGGNINNRGSGGGGGDKSSRGHHHHHHAAGQQQHSYSNIPPSFQDDQDGGDDPSPPTLEDALNTTLFYQPLHHPHSPPTYFCLRCVLLCICSTSASSLVVGGGAGGDSGGTMLSGAARGSSGGAEGTLVEARLAAERATQLLIALHTFTQSQDHSHPPTHHHHQHHPTSEESSLLLIPLCKHLFSSGWVAALFVACLDRLRGESPFHIRRAQDGDHSTSSSSLTSFESLLKRLPITTVSGGGGPCLLQALSALQSEVLDTSSPSLQPTSVATAGWSPRLAALLHTGIHFASTVFQFIVSVVEESMMQPQHHHHSEVDAFHHHHHPSRQQQQQHMLLPPSVSARLLPFVEDVPTSLVYAMSSLLLSSCGLSDTARSSSPSDTNHFHTLTDLLQRVNELDINNEECEPVVEEGEVSSSSMAGSKWRSLFSDSSSASVGGVGVVGGNGSSTISAIPTMTQQSSLPSHTNHHPTHHQDERQGLVNNITTLSESCLLRPILFHHHDRDDDEVASSESIQLLLLATSTSSAISSTYFIPKILMAFITMMDTTLGRGDISGGVVLGGSGVSSSPVQLHLLSMLRRRLLTSCAAPSYQYIQTALITLRGSCDSALELLSQQHQHTQNDQHHHHHSFSTNGSIDDGDQLIVFGTARSALYRLQYHAHILLGGMLASLAGGNDDGGSDPSTSHDLINLMFTTPDESSLLLPSPHTNDSDNIHSREDADNMYVRGRSLSHSQQDERDGGDGLNEDDGNWLWDNPASQTHNNSNADRAGGWDEDSRGSGGALWLTSRPSAGLLQVSPRIGTTDNESDHNHRAHPPFSLPPSALSGFGLRRCLQAAIMKYAVESPTTQLDHSTTLSLAELFMHVAMNMIHNDQGGDHLGDNIGVVDEPLSRDVAEAAMTAQPIVVHLTSLISTLHTAVRSSATGRYHGDEDNDVAAAELARLMWAEDGPSTIISRGIWSRIPLKFPMSSPTDSGGGDCDTLKLTDAVIDEIDFALCGWREFTTIATSVPEEVRHDDGGVDFVAMSDNHQAQQPPNHPHHTPSVSSVLSHLLLATTSSSSSSLSTCDVVPLKVSVDLLHHFLLGPHKDRIDALPHAAAEIGIPNSGVGGDEGATLQWDAFSRHHHLQDHFHITTSLVQCVGITLESTTRQLSFSPSSGPDAATNITNHNYHDSEAHQKRQDAILDVTESLHDLLMTSIPPPSWTGRCGAAVHELLSLTTSTLLLLHSRKGHGGSSGGAMVHKDNSGYEGGSSSWGEEDDHYDELQSHLHNRTSTTSTATTQQQQIQQQQHAPHQQSESSMIVLFLHRSRIAASGDASSDGGGVRGWFQHLRHNLSSSPGSIPHTNRHPSSSTSSAGAPKGLWVGNTLSLVERLSTSITTNSSPSSDLMATQQLVESMMHVVTSGASLGVFDVSCDTGSSRSNVGPLSVGGGVSSISTSSPLTQIIAFIHHCLCQTTSATTATVSVPPAHVDDDEANDDTTHPQMLLSLLLSRGDVSTSCPPTTAPHIDDADASNYFGSLSEVIPGLSIVPHQQPSSTTTIIGRDEFAGLWVSFIAVLVQAFQQQQQQEEDVTAPGGISDSNAATNTTTTAVGELLDEVVFTTLQSFLDGSLPASSAGHDWASSNHPHQDAGIGLPTTTTSSSSSPAGIRILPMYRPLLSLLLLRHLREGHPFSVEVLLARCICGHFTESEEDVEVCALPIVMMSLFPPTTTTTTGTPDTLPSTSSLPMEVWGAATKTTVREVQHTLSSVLLSAESIPQVLRRLLAAVITNRNNSSTVQHHNHQRQHGSSTSSTLSRHRHYGSGRRQPQQQHLMLSRGPTTTSTSPAVLTILMSLLYELSAGSLSFATPQDVTTIFKAAACNTNNNEGNHHISSSDWVSIAYVLWRATTSNTASGTSGGDPSSGWSLAGSGASVIPSPAMLVVPPMCDGHRVSLLPTSPLLSSIGSDCFTEESQFSIPAFLASHLATNNNNLVSPQSLDLIVPMVAHLLNTAISINISTTHDHHGHGDVVDAVNPLVQVLLLASSSSISASSTAASVLVETSSPSTVIDGAVVANGDASSPSSTCDATQQQQQHPTINIALMCIDRVLAYSLLPALDSAISDLVDTTCAPNIPHHDREALIQQTANRIDVILDVWDCFTRGAVVGGVGGGGDTEGVGIHHHANTTLTTTLSSGSVGSRDAIIAVLMRIGSSFVMDHAELINNLVSGSSFTTASGMVRLLLAFTALQPQCSSSSTITTTTTTSSSGIYMPLPLHVVSEPEVCRCVEGLLGALTAMAVTAYRAPPHQHTSTTYSQLQQQDVFVKRSSTNCLRLLRVLYLGFAHGCDCNSNVTTISITKTNAPSTPSSAMELTHRVQMVRGVLASRLVTPVLMSLPDIVQHQPSPAEDSSDWAILLRNAMYKPPHHSGVEWQQQLLVHFTQMQLTCGPCITWPVLRMMLWAGGGMTPSIPSNTTKRSNTNNTTTTSTISSSSSSPVQATIAAVLREAVGVVGRGGGGVSVRVPGCKAPRNDNDKDDEGGGGSDTTTLIQLPPQVMQAVLTA